MVIVGGGPAGASAAYTLASHGLRVCVLDQAAFPREKLCGGLVTLRGKKAFDRVFQQSWDPVIQRVATGAKFFYRGQRLAEIRDYTQLFFTRRWDFDAFLLDLARRRGAVFWPETRPVSLDAVHSVLHLADGRRIACPYLIGADGVHSFVARSLFGRSFNRRTIGFGLEIEVPRPDREPPVTEPEIHFGVVPWGYAWVFPKRRTLTVGVGGRLRNHPDPRTGFQRFLLQRFGALPGLQFKGHHLPFGDFLKRPGRDNILLCGDAAGLVDPLTGEGIGLAILSGYYAAQAIIKALAERSPSAAMEFYLRDYELLARDLRYANFLRHGLFPSGAQALFAQVLPRFPNLARRHLDLLAGNISYAQYSRWLLGGMLQAPFKLVFQRRSKPS